MSYIASNDNRLYAALESTYGQTADISQAQRFPAVRLTAKQRLQPLTRRDKTGTRSFVGHPAGLKSRSEFEVLTYLATWTDHSQPPAYGPLFEAALGASAETFAGGTIASTFGPTRLEFQSAHNLRAGQAIAIGDELRFVSGVPSAITVELNAPFTVTPPAGAEATPTVTYRPGKALPSLSLFDYWSPGTAIQRIIRGAAVNQLDIKINSDFHEFLFRGPACDIADNRTLSGTDGEPSDFPPEPDSSSFDYSIVPGHLGQVWLGAIPDRFYSLTAAQITVANNLETEAREFGSTRLRSVIPGHRDVSVNFDVLASDDEQSLALYEAARHRSGIRAMIQLGTQQGQLCGVYLKSMLPTLPDFDDSESRLLWSFRDCRAQGTGDDEIVVAFG